MKAYYLLSCNADGDIIEQSPYFKYMYSHDIFTDVDWMWDPADDPEHFVHDYD